MMINSTALLTLLYEPKRIFRSRKIMALILVIMFTFCGAIIYLMQYGTQQQTIEQKISKLQDMGADNNEIIALMQKHIESLNSRIQHLSTDNKRLSVTGNKLVEQLEQASIQGKEKLVQQKQLQLELYALDQHLIRKYDSFVEQQQLYTDLKPQCEKAAANNKKCENYGQSEEIISALNAQIKFLKEKREILISEMSRSTGVSVGL